jgi:hypothetical protein
MRIADALDQLPQGNSSAAQRFREALAMFDDGVALQRQNFRRHFPQLSEDELEQLLRRWLSREDSA